MKSTAKSIWFFILFLGALISVSGQSRFYVQSNAKEVLTGSYFEVEFILENMDGSDFEPPDFKGFKLMSGPNRSSNITIANGRRSKKTGYGYTLLALEPGNYVIEPATIIANKRKIKTESFRLRVVKGKQKLGNDGKTLDEVFVKAEISDSTAYPGQQLILKYVLYTSKRISSYNFLSFPELDGFYSQDFKTNKRTEIRVVNGVEYTTQILKALALFPQKLGEIYIEPSQLSFGASRRNDPFNFFGASKHFAVTSNDLMINVNPLPGNAPESFNGAIGKYKMQAYVNSKNITTDDAISLKLEISGTGLSKFIEAPEINLDGKFDVYDPKIVNENIYASKEDIISEKTFEYFLVPNELGRQRIFVEFSYFDTDSSDYVTLKSRSFIINIAEGKNSAGSLDPEDILARYQLKPLMTDTTIRINKNLFFASWGFWSISGLLFLAFPVLLFLKYDRIRKGRIDPDIIRKRKAAKESMKRLATAENKLEENDSKAFYEAISEALNKYVCDKFNIKHSDLSRQNIKNVLLDAGIEQNLIELFITALDKTEMALYAGTTPAGDQAFYHQTKSLLQDLELNISN